VFRASRVPRGDACRTTTLLRGNGGLPFERHRLLEHVRPLGITTGDGLITWSYTPGDFSNGTGHYIYVNLPPYAVPPYYVTNGIAGDTHTFFRLIR